MKKKLLLVVTTLSMMAALAGCGSEGMTLKTEATTTEATTRATTEADIIDTEDDFTTEEEIDDVTTSASADDFAGYEELNNVYFLVGDLKEITNDSGTVVYANDDRSETIAIYTGRDSVYEKDAIYDAYEQKIKQVYGENCEYTSYVTDDLVFTEYDYLEGNTLNSAADVKTYIYTDGDTIIYLEHAVMHGTEFPITAELLMDSIIIK